MSKSITPQVTWAPMDIDAICKLYDTTKTGTSVRQGNRAAAVSALVSSLNHLLANSTRVVFQQGCCFAFRATASADPLYVWRYDDNLTNETVYRYRILAAPRTSGSGAATAQRQGDATVITAESYNAMTSPSFPEDTFFGYAERTRGAATGGLDNEGVTTNNNYSIVDICVHSKPLPALEISVHDVMPGQASFGDYVVANILEGVRSRFQELRQNCLPVLFQHHCQGITATPASTDATAIVVTSTSYVNILDQTVTARDETTPGFLFDVYKCALGIETRVPIGASFYATKVDGGSPANAAVKFEGPDHVASNTVEVTNVTGAGAWYNLATNVYGNSAVDCTDVTTERNKIDVFAKVGHADDALYIYDICGRMAWAI